MSNPENLWQKWVWEGLNGKFNPDGDLSIDDNKDDVFTGTIFFEEHDFQCSEFGPAIEKSNLALTMAASIMGSVGQPLCSLIDLPSCGNEELDEQVKNALITHTEETETQINLMIGT